MNKILHKKIKFYPLPGHFLDIRYKTVFFAFDLEIFIQTLAKMFDIIFFIFLGLLGTP